MRVFCLSALSSFCLFVASVMFVTDLHAQGGIGIGQFCTIPAGGCAKALDNRCRGACEDEDPNDGISCSCDPTDPNAPVPCTCMGHLD
jgi:hypothetical protein